LDVRFNPSLVSSFQCVVSIYRDPLPFITALSKSLSWSCHLINHTLNNINKYLNPFEMQLQAMRFFVASGAVVRDLVIVPRHDTTWLNRHTETTRSVSLRSISCEWMWLKKSKNTLHFPLV